MKLYGKSEEVVKKILDQFESGELPKALKPIFIKRTDNVPSAGWSWNNQFIMAIYGTSDARGIHQWNDAGRSVKKGSHAFPILGPLFAKIKKTDEKTGEEKEDQLLYGFKSIPVFRIEDTEITDQGKWEKSGTIDIQEEIRLKELPLREVAELWNLKITSYNGERVNYLGYYKHGETIALGVKNLSTWTHELTHAADDRNGTLNKNGFGQKQDNEIVAELGGATLLEIMGYHVDADLGGAWDYIKVYAGNDNGKAIRKCMEFVNRICSYVNLIIKTSEEINNQKLAA